MSTPRLSPDDIRAAAEVHRELGPEYRDAVAESFLEKIDGEIAARIDSRLTNRLPARRRNSGHLARRPGVLTGLVIGATTAGIPLTLLAVYLGYAGQAPGWPVKLWFIWAAIAVICGACAVRFRKGRER